jgi:transcriptional regulator with XRE-family HTH domain
MSIEVGKQLRAVRTAFGLSQRELAKRASVTNGMISLIEQDRVSPSIGSLQKILSAFPMTMAEFFTRDMEGQEQNVTNRRRTRARICSRIPAKKAEWWWRVNSK